MEVPVKLYVYDLSNGMARQMSRQLTGRQIDGIWHTSVVVYGKEIFYGRGIDTTLPGRSHHGSPMQVIDMGQTAIDEETFGEYLAEMRDHYTADKYHLLDFNCNSFTNDCIGFLTGGSIPEFIKDLPTDFLSTPFGAAMRPTIDAMYRRPSAGAPTPAYPSPDSQLAASLLQNVASNAQASTTPAASATQTLTAPIHVITNPPAFNSFLRSHRAAVAFFTDHTCAPCKMIEPVFERLSEEKGVKTGGAGGAGFAKIDIGVGLGQSLASEWGIRATPTFIFFLDGKKLDELKGADANELRSQVDLLLFQAYPAHPHTSLSLPAIQALSLNPILFTQVPALDTVLSKLSSFIDSAPWVSIPQTKTQVKQTLTGTVAPYLKSRFATPASPQPASATPHILTSWSQATSALTAALPAPSLFPLVDLWRLALLDPAVSTWVPPSPSLDPIALFLTKAASALRPPLSTSTPSPRNYILTTLRLLANAFSSPALARRLLLTSRATMTSVLVPSLLHEDGAVRTAAASLAFNVAAFIQKGRVAKVRGEIVAAFEDEDWEVEIVSAAIEALDRETASEDVVHRLTACLAFLLRLSPAYEMQLLPLLDVLQAQDVLKRKLAKGGCGETGVVKKEVRKLIEEVAGKLCG